MFLCSFLPWGRVLLFTINGTDGDGVIAAILAFGSAATLFAVHRMDSHRVALAATSTARMMVATSVLLFDAARFARLVPQSEGDNMFEIEVTLGFGLLFGVAAGVTGIDFRGVTTYRPWRGGSIAPAIDEQSALVKAPLVARAYAVSAAVVADWWHLAIGAGLVGLALVLFGRYQAAVATTPEPWSRIAIGGLVMGLLGILGGAAWRIERAIHPTGPAACSEVFTDGVTTKASWDGFTTCLEDGKPQLVVSTKPLCLDHRRSELPLTNEYGWGYPGKPWQAGEPYDCN